MAMPEIAIDLDDFPVVRARALARVGKAMPETDPAVMPCARALASNRLWIRRYAMGLPPQGTGWSYRDHLHLIDQEIGRMREDGSLAICDPDYLETWLRGCGSSPCLFCHPPTCQKCGGVGN